MSEKIKKRWQKNKKWVIAISLLLINIFVFLPRFLPSQALTSNIYSTDCSGDWFGADRVIGQPDVSASGSFEDFNTENSAFYKSGFQSIVCQGYEADPELKKTVGKFISARLGISLAINEIFKENKIPESPVDEEITNQEVVTPAEETTIIEEGESEQLEPIEGEPKPDEVPVVEPETQPEIIPENQEQPVSWLFDPIRNLLKIFPVKAQADEAINIPLEENELVIEEPLPINSQENINQENQFLVEEQNLNQEPVILPPEALPEPEAQPEVVADQTNAILNLRYSLDDQNYLLDTFSLYPDSPNIHGDYFYFDLPAVQSLDDLKKIKIYLEGLLEGDPRLIAYLDSVWIEISYQEEIEITPPILEMEKKVWRLNEEPVIKIENTNKNLTKKEYFTKSLVKKLDLFSEEPTIDLTLIDPDKKEKILEIEKDFQLEENNDFSQIKLLKSRSFKPGLYKLKYKISQGDQKVEVEYDFRWGVLAINTNKSIYLLNEEAYLQMAVLSDSGRTICDAKLQLEIVNSVEETIILSTEEGTIQYSNSCGPNNVTDQPDYFAYAQLNNVGVYEIKLTNLDNNYEITDSFIVQNAVPFEVERIGATRINPFESKYSLTINIKANQDFEGKIIEQVPENFEITFDDQFIIENKNNIQEIIWQKKLLAGEEIVLRYQYQAPRISPQLYLLGPLKIQQNENIIFEEVREWQIAADSTNMLLFWAGEGGTCDSPPDGWEVVQDGSFSETFPRGDSSYTASEGGSADHTHTAKGESSASSTGLPYDGAVMPGADLSVITHTHSVTVDDVSTSNSLPEYKDLCVIKLSAGGIPSGSEAIPLNAIAIFAAAPPDGWSDYSATFGTYYIRGNIVPDATGGSNTHDNPGHTVTGSLDADSSTLRRNAGINNASAGGHTHTFSLQSTDTPSIEPLSQEVILGQKTDAAGPLVTGMIAMFDGNPGGGWDIKSDASDDFYNKYIKVTGTYQNNDTGATSHNHSQISGASSSYKAALATGKAGLSIGSHDHPVTIDLEVGTNTNLPPYTDVVIAQKVEYTVSGTSDSTGTVKVAFDGSVQSETGTISGGSWSITTTSAVPTTNQIVTVWIDGAAEADESTAVTKYDGSGNSTGMVLNRHVLSIGSSDNPSVTVTNLNQYDNDDDEDIMHDANSGGTSGALKVDDDDQYTNEKIDVLANATLTIGTSESLSTHDVAINGSLTSSGTGTFNVSGSWDNNNDFNTSGETINFTSTTIETIDSTGASDADVNKVVLNGADGQWTLTTALVINDDLTVTAGTLAGTSNLTVSGGDITGDGTINLTGGTALLDGTGNFGGDTAWTFNALTFGDGSGTTTTTATGSGAIEADGLLTIAANQTLDAGSKTWNLDANVATPFVVSGVFTPNSSTFAYTGYNSLGGNVNITATTYNSLKVDCSVHSATTYDLTGATALNGDLTITAGTLDVTGGNHNLNVKGSWTNNDTFTAQTGTVTFDGTSSGKTINSGPSSFNNLTFNGTGGEWTLTTNNLDVNATLNINKGTLIASTLNINLAQTLAIGATGYFTKGSGTFTFDGNGAVPIAVSWNDNNVVKQDMGIVVIDGSNNLNISITSSVKATTLNIISGNTLAVSVVGSTITLSGSGTGASKPLTVGGNLILGNSTVEYTGSSTTDVTNLVGYYNLTINGSGTFTAEAGALLVANNLNVTSGTFNLGGITTVTNDLSISTGTLDVTTSNLSLIVAGSWTNSGGTFNARAGLVTFSSVGSETITTNSQPFYKLTFGGAGAWVLQDALDINNDFAFNTGTLTQAANANINFGGNVTIEDGTTFNKAGGTGLVIFDGTGATYTDNNVTKENLGNVEIGTSPDDIILCSDKAVDSLTINGGDVFYLNGWNIDVTNDISVLSTGTFDAETDQSGVCAAGGTNTVYLENNWTVASDGIFKAGSSSVVFDGAASEGSNIDAGGTDDDHDFYDFTMAKTPVAIGVASSLAGDLRVSNQFVISTADSNLDVSASNYDIYISGNWTNSGTFTAGKGTVTFDAGTTGKTIRTGGTAVGKTFYNIIFNNAAGGWSIATADLTATNNFSITDTDDAADSFTVEAGRTITVNGNFTNLQGGDATKWTDTTLNLTKTGGGSYTINTKTTGADEYATLEVGTNTDVRMWNSLASTYTVDASGSLYSMDQNSVDGALYIWGDYHTTTGNTDYWSYATDFDGTALGGSSRQAKVYINVDGEADDNITVDVGGILNVIGGGAASNDITIVGQDTADLFDFDCSGTCNVQESTWNYLNLTGGTLTLNNSVLNNEDAPDGGTLNVDWYLGDYVVDRVSLTPIQTANNTDITISSVYQSPGAGTPISSWTDLNNIRNDLSGDYYLTRNLLTTDADYVGIGDSWQTLARHTLGTYFTGTFDGRGYLIDGLTINEPGNYYVSLFGDGGNWITFDTTEVSNLGLTNVNLVGDWGVAPFFSGLYGTVSNCYATGTVTGDAYVGGLVGNLVSSGPTIVTNSYSTVDVIADGDTRDNVGGLVGGSQDDTSIYNSYATGSVTNGDSGVGGLVGEAYASISNSYATGSVTGFEYVGGLVGFLGAGSIITNSGWYTGSGPTYAIGSTSENVTYNETDSTVFYDKRHDVYDTTAPYWNFASVWRKNESSYPTLQPPGDPFATVFKWSGASWSAGATSQATGTGADGKIPQPGGDGAIKIREYSRTSGGFTFYKYNIYINWQGSTYGEYDYYRGYGQKYITSTLNTNSNEDECISESWQRNNIDVQNAQAQDIDEPPTNGTWYNGMISGLSITIDDYSIDFGSIVPGAAPTNQTNTITISTSAPDGYILYAWSTQAMTRVGGSETISDWAGTNASPTNWATGAGFGYKTNDSSLIGGTINRFTSDGFCSASGGNGCWAGFSHSDLYPVADRTEPSSAQTNIITYRFAAGSLQTPGTYTTTIVYVVVPNY